MIDLEAARIPVIEDEQNRIFPTCAIASCPCPSYFSYLEVGLSDPKSGVVSFTSNQKPAILPAK